MTLEQQKALALAKARAAAEQNPSTAMDVAKGFGSGVRSGIESMGGFVGDIRDMATEGAVGLGNMIGANEQVVRQVMGVPSASPTSFMPSTADIQARTDSLVGPRYEPKTTAGQFARTAGEFLPNAAAPGGLVRKGAMVALPAIASEGLGQATEGTTVEPFARVGGALVGGHVAARQYGEEAAQIVANAAKRSQFANGAELKAEINKGYQTLRDAGVGYDPNKYAGMIAKATKAIETFPSSIAPQANGMLSDLAKRPLLSFSDIDGQSSALGKAIRSAEKAGNEAEASALGRIKDQLDEFAISPSVVADGIAQLTPKQMAKLRADARALVVRSRKANLVERAIEAADDYVGGFQVGLNNQISSLLRNKATATLFNGPEKAVLRGILEGRKAWADLAVFGVDTLGGAGIGATVGTVARMAGQASNYKGLRKNVSQLPQAMRSGEISRQTVEAAQRARDEASRKLLSIFEGYGQLQE